MTDDARLRALCDAAEENINAYAAGWMGGKKPQYELAAACDPATIRSLLDAADERDALKDEREGIHTVYRQELEHYKAVLPKLEAAERERDRLSKQDSCPARSSSGRYQEPIRCAFERGHSGAHSWATLPTFTNGRIQSEDMRDAMRLAGDILVSELLVHATYKPALDAIKAWNKLTGGGNPAAPLVLDAAEERDRLRDELERERVRLAGCGVAAMQNTASSIKDRCKSGDYGHSASYDDVCRAVDREIALRAAAEQAREALQKTIGDDYSRTALAALDAVLEPKAD